METKSLKILNPSDQAVKYKLKNKQSVSILPYNTTLQGYAPLNPPGYDTNNVIVKLNITPHEVYLQPGESVDIHLDVLDVIGDTKEIPYPIYGGYIQFVPEDQDSQRTIHVPYIGIKGSLSQLPIFDNHYPKILVTNGTKTFEKLMDDKLITGFVLDRSDRSSLYIDSVFRLLTGTPHIQTEVLDYDLNLLGVFARDNYLSRNTLSPQDYIFSQRWNGTIIPNGKDTINEPTELMPGLYFLRWKALKLLSDPSAPDSWESKLSPPILIRN